MKKIIALLALYSATALAAGGGHGSPMDLLYPAINVFAFFGFLFWKVTPVIRKSFQKKHAHIKETAERVKVKSFEAKTRYEQQLKKNEKIPQTVEQIKMTAKSELEQFKQKYSSEVDHKIEKLKTDAQFKIDAEKESLLSELNSELVNLVIAKAKNQVRADKSLQNQLSGNLIKGLK